MEKLIVLVIRVLILLCRWTALLQVALKLIFGHGVLLQELIHKLRFLTRLLDALGQLTWLLIILAEVSICKVALIRLCWKSNLIDADVDRRDAVEKLTAFAFLIRRLELAGLNVAICQL